MNARPANRRLISRAALVLLALVALAILFGGAPTASADDPPQVPSADPPEAPHRLRVSPGGSGELAASWRAPHDDGGSPIIGYKVQWKSGSEHYDDSASSTRQAVITDPNRLGHTIRGLSNGTEYTVRVIATNSVGDGPPSLEESATTHPEPGDEPDGSRGGYGGDGVYTWRDGDRVMRVRLEPDEDPQRYGGGEGEPVFRSDSGGGVMTLPGGVLLVLDPSWTGSEVKRFFSGNGIKASRVTELGFAENAYFVETEPGFPSLQLANTLAGEEGVVISSPNWTTEVTTDDGDENEDPVEDPGDTIGTAIDLTLDTKVNATISSYEDLDYYRFQLVESTVIWIHASLSSFTVLDTDGEEVLPEGNDGGFRRGKSIRRLGAGVYYLKFSHRTSCSTEDINCLGPYYVQVNAISDQGDTIESATLLNVSPGYDIADSWNPAYSTVGDLPSESDVDFFKVELDAATEVVIRVDAQLVLDWFGFHNTVSLAVFDKDGNPLHPPGVGMSWNGDRSYSLNAGTYYFRLARLIQDWTSDKMWYYHVWFYENLEYTKFIEDCTGIETPFGDPLSGCQTHLGSSETGDLGINVQDVWETNKGEGIYVAVVDREVDYDHEDLRDNINRTLSHDYIEEDQLVLRLTGHGTSVAGLIAARDNELGVRGVAPRATIVGYNYLENGTLLNRADALTRNMDLVAVSNASFGKTGTGHPRPVSQTYTMALETGVSQGFGGKGTFYVHSAGNSHSYTSHVNLREQKNFYAVTTVCSVESDGTRADYSETGYALWVCAPIAKVTTENWNRYSDDFGGTSSAAPLVSGVAALIRSAHPSLTWRDVKLILAASAQHNDPDNASWREGALEYNSVTERYFYNPEYGFGVIDAEAALDLAESWTNLPPMKSTGADSGEIDLTIPDLTEDGDSTTVTRELFLNSDVGFTEFVEVTIDFHHPAFRDLDIEIESPSGTFSKLTVPSEKNGLRRSELYSTFRFGSAAHLGEDPSGVWTLRVTDHFEELEITSRPAGWSLGKIKGWSIKVYGHGLGVAPPSILILPQDQDWHDVPESAAPSSPQDLVVIPGDGRLTVKWLPSDEEDSPPVTAYKVQWKRGAQGWDTPGDVFEGTVTHLANLVTGGGEYAVQVPALTNGVAYTVRVIAVTSTGDSRLGEIRRVIPGIPGVAAILQELCDRTEQVRDAVMARKSYIGDCSIVTNLHLETVRGLDLEDSGIEALLAEDFRGLSNLEWLALSANDLSELPEGVFDDLSSLERLTLSSNDLSALPEGVFNDLSSLEILTLYSNDLSALPEGVFDDLTNLERLDLSGNDFSALPEGVFDDLTNLKQLSLSGNDLSEWPESVFNDLSSLEWLSLHGNDLSELPEGALDGLTNMERLFLYQNALSKLPEGVFDKLSNLRVLYLWGNDLSALPEGVFDDLTNLESLALGANDLSALPEGVFDDLSSLELLTLARNGLSALPEGVFDDLSSLESLTLDGNDLSALPEGVFDDLTNLESLALGANDLSGLPDDLFDGLSGIRQLELHDNPGAPFTFTAELSQVAAVAVVIELAQAVPFDMVVTLSAQGGLLSTSTVTVDAGTSRSEQIRVTPDDEGPVTLTLVSAAFQSSAPAGGLNFQFEGIEAVLGQPLTLRDAKGDNTPATGLPTIVGTTRMGETLTAHTSGIHDADGLTGATFSYQWIVNDTNADTEIQGATASSYTLVSADERKMIKVTVTFIDNGFNEESLTSEPTATVSPPKYTKVPDTPDTPTGTAVFIGGVDLEWNEVPEAESYEVQSFRNGQWIDLPGDGVEIAFYGAGAIISQLNHEGASYWFRVRAGNPLGYSEWSDYHWMEPTYTHDSGKQVRPGNVSPTGVPTIVGTAHVGETLTASASAIEDANGLGRVKFSYQWVSYNGTTDTDIRRATDAAYTLTTADQGKTIKVRVSFTDRGGYAESLTSAESQAVTNNDSASNTPATGLPTISGTAQVGKTLTADTSGIDDADGLDNVAFSFQWLADDVDITGATSDTYTLVEADFDKAVKVRVIFNDDDANEETLTSEPTAAVAAKPNSPATGAPTISGTVRVGDLLTAHTSDIADPDGLNNVEYNFNWGAGDYLRVMGDYNTYRVQARDVGLTIKVWVGFTDEEGNLEILTSADTVAVVATTPAAPQHLNVSHHGTGALDLSWEAPIADWMGEIDGKGTHGDGGSPITGYKVQWKSGSEDYDGSAGSTRQAEITDPASRTHTITGLTDGVEYAVRVIAVNDVGDGPPSDEATGTPRETTPPELATATVDGPTLTLTYDEDLDENSEPSSDAFSVAVGGTGRAVDGVSVSGSSVILTLGSAVASGATVTVTVSYAVPTDAAAPRIQDEAGNPAASFSDQDVENNTPPPANTPATGAPTISGTAQVGETLTVDTSGIDDEDGLANVSFSYQWLADDTEIAGATDPTYTLVDADAGLTIKVKVSFFDDKNNPETLTSAATAAVDPDPGPITGFTVVDTSDQSVEGALADGGTLALDDPDGGSFGIRADLESGATIGSMRLQLTGEKTHDQTENIAPYSLYGDSGGNLSGESLPVGEYTLTATAYSEARLGGNVLGALKVSFTVTGPATQQTNTPATGLPTISGTAQVGKTLTASASDIDDADGIGNATFSYQWIAGTTDIPGATGSTYAPLVADLGKTIKVRVSFDDDQNNFESLTSAATAAVAAKPNTPATGAPTISGTARVGETLRADISGIADVDGMSGAVFSYQWLANEVNIDTDIAGATDPTYTLVADDLGKTIKVRVSFMDGASNVETLTSEATATVVTPLTAEFQDAPVDHPGTGVFTFVIAFSEPISISYATLRDDSLEVTNGSATKAKRENGQSDLWEITVEPDSDADVTVVLPITEDCTAQDAVCTRDGTKLSNRSELTVPGPAAANSPATGAPSISGTAQVGETLTVDTSGIDDADGMSGAVFSYQWLANGVDIAGATSDTYTPVADDVGKAVKVRVIFNDDDNNEETLTSPATAAVAAETAAPDAPRSLNVSPDDTGTLDVSWEAPASDGGSAITGYKVQWKSGSEDYDGSAGSTRQAEISDPASRTHTITGLTDGVEYAVRVIAVNDVGDGPPSDEATATPRETTPPELATATVYGTTLTLTYDEALDENSEPSSDAFSVTVGGTGRAVDGVSVSGSSVTLTLGSAVASGATVTVSYTAPTDAAAPRIQDEAGNPAASFSDQDVENKTPPPANSPATGAPTISGTAQAGETLTASTSDIDDADGLDNVGYSYQWLANGADIAGATSSSYTLVEADNGKTIQVNVSFRDDRNHQESLTSAATAAVEPRPNSPATGAPTISGTARVGETLTASTSDIDDADGLDNVGYSYQWLANGADIAGATSSSYTLVEADNGKTIQVNVSFRDDRNHQESLTSAATAAVEPRPNSPATGAPTISGTARVGETLTASTSDIDDADGLDNVGYSYQWLADDADIAGATSDTYTLVDADLDKAVKVRVIFTDNADNEETLTSEATAAVEPRPNSPATGAPTISGTVRVGETLTAETSAIADADGLDNVGYSYQWLANGADIAGATSSTYTLVDDDAGLTIKVKVSFRDDRNNQESLTSAATAAVTAAADDSAVWSATLTVGESWGFVGFWKGVCGVLDPDEFSLDGNDYPISMFAELSDRYFQFRLDQALPVAFTPRVGETTFESKDAEQLGGSSSGVYQWTGQLAGLTEGSTVEVSLTLAE